MPRVKLAPAKKLISNPQVPHATSSAISDSWTWSADWDSTNTLTQSPETKTASFAPLSYERGYRYPLLVWLHGEGSNEHDLPAIMRHVSIRNYVAVAPRGVILTPENDSKITDEGYSWEQSSQSIERAEEVVAEAIELTAERFNLHEERVFIAGTGVGGTMALRLALRRPEWFAGAATIDGPMPTGHRPLSRVNEVRQLPILISSSRKSLAYPEPQVCRDLSLLHSAGCRVAVRQYPGSDDLTTNMLADLDRWAMDLICGPAA